MNPKDDDRGYPMISYKVPNKDIVRFLKEYAKWQKPSNFYAGRMGIIGYIPDFVEYLIEEDEFPVFSKEELEAISHKIEQSKIIPVLSYAHSEFFNYTKQVWWIVPFCIWKDEIASMIFIDKNGFYALIEGDESIDFTVIFAWDRLQSMEFEPSYDDDPNVNRLTLYADNGTYLTFDEFVSEGEDGNLGSYLGVIESIWQVRKTTINVSKGEPFWYEGAGGEGFQPFIHPLALLQDSQWLSPNRPDPSWYGYSGQQSILHELEEKFEEGKELYEEQKYPEAIVILMEYLDRLPNDSPLDYYFKAHNVLGDCFKEKYDYSGAIPHYLKVLKSDPNYLDAITSIAFCYLHTKQYDEALRYYALALEQKETYVGHYFAGLIYAIKGEFNEAIDHLNKSIALNKEYEPSYNIRGKVNRDLKNFDDALKDFEKCVDLNPDELDYRLERGLIYNKLEKYNQSNEDLLLIIDKPEYSENDNTHYIIALNFKETDQYDLALEHINNAIRLNDSYATLYNEQGEILEALNRIEEAKDAFKKAIALNPNWATPNVNLGILYKKTGSLKEAIAVLNKAVSLNAEWNWPKIELGECYLLEGSYEEAISYFDQAIESGSKLRWVRYNRGLSHHLSGSYEKAIEDYNQVEDYEKSNLCWYYNLESARHQASAFVDSEEELLVTGKREYLISALIARGRKTHYHADNTYNYDLSFKDLDKAIELDATNYLAYYIRGVKHSETDWLANYEERAIADFKACIANNEYAPAFRELAKLLGNTSEALECLKKAIQLDSSDSESLIALGNYYLKEEDYYKAVEAFKASYELNESKTTCDLIGKAYFQLALFEDALVFFEKTISLDAENGNYFYTALCHKQLKNWSSALENIINAIRNFLGSHNYYYDYYLEYLEIAKLNKVSNEQIDAIGAILGFHREMIDLENTSADISESEINLLLKCSKEIKPDQSISLFTEVLNSYEFNWGTYTWFQTEAPSKIKEHILRNENLSDRFSEEERRIMQADVQKDNLLGLLGNLDT